MNRDREALIVSTTEGRQRLPDLIQQVYGGVVPSVVFERYGRKLAVLVPLAATIPALPPAGGVEEAFERNRGAEIITFTHRDGVTSDVVCKLEIVWVGPQASVDANTVLAALSPTTLGGES